MAVRGTFNLDAFREALEERKPIALARGLEYLRSVVTPLVPVQTGNLVGSIGITVYDDMGEIFIPGPYALYQHEGVYYRHGKFGAPLTHTHGESFFLERPMVQEADNIFKVMDEALYGDG